MEVKNMIIELEEKSYFPSSNVNTTYEQIIENKCACGERVIIYSGSNGYCARCWASPSRNLGI